MPPLPSPDVPVIAAPMAGGPSTPALVAAAGGAGGMGFLAGGYLSADALDAQLDDLAGRSAQPYGVNLFLPAAPDPDPAARAAAVAAYAARLTPEAVRYGVELGEPRTDDDAVDAKIAVLARHRPAVVSVTFALPSAARYAALRETGAALVATVTSVDEALAAQEQGFDGLWVQGAEAGGHRGVHHDAGGDAEAGAVPLAELLPIVRATTDLPLIAAGGLADGADVARVVAAGAVAAGLGTAFLCCPEAGTSATHRAALRADGARETVVTRAFTGRPARALANRFTAAHSADAPPCYPELHHLTRPVRAAAASAGDPEAVHLWAGTAYRRATEEPAGEIVARLGRECRDAGR